MVQDAAVHKYVALVGTVLTEQTTRPKLPWTFIVLDTDGVNAFAAPGGFVHITRGALGLIKTEAELAGVLAHEIAHVAQKHTVNAIQKSKGVQLGTARDARRTGARSSTRSRTAPTAWSSRTRSIAATSSTPTRKASSSCRRRATPAPGLSDFLARLAERNKGQAERNGLFASHPGNAGAHRQGQAACGLEARRGRGGPVHLEHQVSADRHHEGRGRRRRLGGPHGRRQGATEAPKPEEKKAEEKKKGFGLEQPHEAATGGRTSSRWRPQEAPEDWVRIAWPRAATTRTP